MVFTSDNLADFDHTSQFDYINNKKKYNEWRQNRIKFSPEIDSWEPVGCFEFTNPENESISFKLDHKKEAKYIFFKPTNLRQTPKDFSKKYGIESVEIKFFGVQGQLIYDESNISNNKNAEKKRVDSLKIEDCFLENLKIEVT